MSKIIQIITLLKYIINAAVMSLKPLLRWHVQVMSEQDTGCFLSCLGALREIITMFLTNVMEHTEGQCHSLTQLQLAVVSF